MGWEAVNAEKKAAIVSSINKIEPVLRFDPSRCAVDSLVLPFYQKAALYRFLKEDPSAQPLWYVSIPGEVVALDGSSANISYINRVAPLMLDDNNLYNYIKYLFFFTARAQVFEQKVRRSAVGYSGKVWSFETDGCFEIDINLSPRGVLTELDRVKQDEVSAFVPDEFSLD